MTTFCITVPALKSITRGLSSDWGPTLHAAARRLGAVVALIYTLGFMAGERWHQLVAWAQEHQLHGLARLGLPAGNLKASLTGSAQGHFPAVTKMVTQPLAPALPPARSVNVTPPRTGIIHISDPMVRALRMVHEGKSQRLAAHLCGVSRTSLQRALKA
jgi:hypothetical protein